MIVKFKSKWNTTCDSIADFYLRKNSYFTQENEKSKYIIEKIKYILTATIPRTYKFISMCNYYQTPTVTLFKRTIAFDYKKRNILVCSLSIASSVIYQKGFFKSYIGLSALICRENLNIRNYKFKSLPISDSNILKKDNRNNSLSEDIKNKVNH